MALIIEVLCKAHDRAGFDCGDQQLNSYLQKMARQHLGKGISKSFVLVDTDNPAAILAYMTLVVCEVHSSAIPHHWKKQYPERIPAARLARLAVALKHQQKGYGGLLMVDAMAKTVNVSHDFGVAGLFVGAKHEKAKNYYQQFGFISLPDQLDNLFLPLTTLVENLEG